MTAQTVSQTYHALCLAPMYVHVDKSFQGHYIEIGGCFIIFSGKEHISQKKSALWSSNLSLDL
ncbi:hypothetical protein B0H14DRAFT_3476740 [Mycena olivaceomarginata]|nr:hypothetical protein B0H14DRAFT_3476740 [Mycena olivaceomarginata]